MTNTTATYWSVDGVSLQTFAQNIETLGGGRDTPPPVRGDNVVVPYRVGQRWVPKTPDQRIIPLAMWVRGVLPDETSGSLTPEQQYADNWDALKKLLWQPGRQFVLQKRFWVNGALRSASALAEYDSGLSSTMVGRAAGKFAVSLKLTDPFFYDDNPTIINPLATGDNTVVVPGDADTTNMTITVNGSRIQPTILNKTNNIQLRYADTVATGDVVTISPRDWTSSTTPSGSGVYDSQAKIQHSGDAQWMKVAAGSNVINLSSSSGTGAVVMSVKGAWF